MPDELPTVDQPTVTPTGPPSALQSTDARLATWTGEGAAPAGPPGYELLSEVGRGGMGVVFRARDARMGREVAVKLLADRYPPHGAAARRFLAEARITGQLQHPGVPPVHEVGELADGRPFLAMKLIKGRTLAEVLDATPDRGTLLAVFEKVCETVAYAHSKGVIHRDLKPANVMVGAFGEVQVMDWGLAKVLADAPDEADGLTDDRHPADATRSGDVMGTPAYMAPEQARGGPADRRTDVFGLGAVLCALLTGEPPYSGGDALGRQQLAARAELGDAFARLGGCGAEPELVALCERCLAATPADRPADAGQVAAAVAALRAEAAERARAAEVGAAAERARAAAERARRRGQVWLGGLAAALLAGGLLATGAQWRRTQAALGDALRQKGETEAALAGKAAALAEAEASRDKTVQVLRRLTDQAVQDQTARQAALTADDRAFLRDVRAYWEEVAATRGDAPASRALRAEGAFRTGLVWQNLGELDEAEHAYRTALDLRGRLAADYPGRPEYLLALAATHNNLGSLLHARGRTADAESAFRAAIALEESLVAGQPAEASYRQELARSYNVLGVLLRGTGRLAEAEAAYRDAFAQLDQLAADRPDQPDLLLELAGGHTNLAVWYQSQERWADAEGEHRAARRIEERLVARHPARADCREGLAATDMNLGVLFRETRRPAEAEAAMRAAAARYEQLAAEYPARPSYRQGLARTHHNLGNMLQALGPGRAADAEAAARAALAQYERLAAEHPGNREHRLGLGVSCTSLAILCRTAGRPADSILWADKAVSVLAPLHAADPGQVQVKRFLRNTYSCRARALGSAGRHADAAADWDRVIALSPASEREHLRLVRVASLRRSGRVAEAVAEVVSLAERGTWGATDWYAMAVVLAAGSRELPGRVSELAAHSVALLRRAVAAGLSDAARLSTDPDLAPLRDRPDFKQLLASLPEPAPPPRPAR